METLFFLSDFLQKVVISLEYFARTECKLKQCNSMRSEMKSKTETHFTYLYKIFKPSRLTPTKPVTKGVNESRLISNLSEGIFRVLFKVYEE